MDIDVVIPSAGDARMLASTLGSVAAAADRAGLPRERVTVVDDRPHRGISPLLDDLGFVRAPGGDLGRSGARNLGARAGGAPWIVFIDDDVELDAEAIVALDRALAAEPAAVVGGLRPPDGSPAWLHWAYADAVLTTAAAAAGPADLSLAELASAVCAVRRVDLDAVGGFPHVDGWGGEDVLLGLALASLRPGGRLVRLPAFGGVHHHIPSWDEWLERRYRAGEQVARLQRQLTGDERDLLLQMFGQGSGARARMKRLAGRLPPGLLRRAPGRPLRRIAAAAMEARGYRVAAAAS